MNKQQLQQEIEQLKKQLEEKQKALAAIPDKWEPKGGSFVILGDGNISELNSFDDYRYFGSEYATRQQAEKAAKAMRTHNRLLAYVAEFAPDSFCSELCFASVTYDPQKNKWVTVVQGCMAYRSPTDVYMPTKVAEELASKLNSGEVEL